MRNSINENENSCLLEANGLTKSFGPIEVLHGIDLAVRSGEIHAVIGENGAGKSTLMRLLAGNLAPSGGAMAIDGKPVSFASPSEAEAAGIVLVHQEILLAPDLTVAQNIFLGREVRRGLFLDDRMMNDEAMKAVRELGAEISPDMPVSRLSIAKRQLVQIARVLLTPHRMVIFDEPTASLTPVETEALLSVIRTIRDRGVAVLFISHRLNEVKAIADTVTILRDGHKVATYDASELEAADMARMMVGRDVSKLYPDRNHDAEGNAVLAVEGFTVPGYAEKASFQLKKGEILGFAGLVGAGRTELLEGILGLRPGRGDVRLNGRKVQFKTPAAALQSGIVYLSEDRKGKGLLLAKDLKTNLTLAALDRFIKGLQVSGQAEDQALDKAIEEFDIRTGSKSLDAGELSGGNQQKLLLAKMMLLEPDIVVIDEPTRGIDIGNKEQIYRFIAELAEAGHSIIVISSEMPELLGLCDRIMVMRSGQIAGELSGERMNENEIVVLATGVGHADRADMAEAR